MINNIKAYVDGKFIEKDNRISIYSPETTKIVGTMPGLTKVEIDNAYTAANLSQKKWAQQDADTRIKIVKKWANLLEKNKDIVAHQMVEEIAKPLMDCIAEVVRSVQYAKDTIKEYKKMYSQTLDSSVLGKNKTAKIFYKPLGVVLVISPFNYPINLSITKLVPALLTGNTIVFKSATNGTLSCSILAKMAHEVGFPKGVFNFVTGRGRDIGSALIDNKHINAIMFTGGTNTGINLAKNAGLVKLILELGGNDPAIVCEDANLEKTANAIIKGAFSYSGQRCTAIKRVFVYKAIKDKLIKLVAQKISNLSVGKAINNCFITSIINKQSADFVDELIDDAIKSGAKVVDTRKRINNLIWPVIIDNATANMRISIEEQFGPALPFIEITSDEQAIKFANDTNYGLQACVFTENTNRANKIAMQLEVGSVNINSQSQRGPDLLPFVGVKHSGLTTQGIKYALYSLVREFNIVINK